MLYGARNKKYLLIINILQNDEKTSVTQFQYHGWPTVEGQVPEVTRGLIELADQAQAHQSSQQNTGSTAGPMVVHCM